MRLSCLTCTLALVTMGNAYAADTVASPDTSGLSKQEAKDGFKSIFDGKTLDGWQGDIKGYAAENGILICKHPGGGRLFSADEHDNFIYRFEFKLPPGGNNGIAIRSPLGGATSRDGIEIQVIDNTADRYKNIKPYQFHGSIYGMVPAKQGYLKPVGQWNSQEIVCDGPHIKITLNGTVIVDANLDDIGETTIDGREHPGRFRKTGHIGFLGHGARVEFRNLRIKKLSANQSAAAEPKQSKTPLFDGKSFNGWEGNLSAFRIEDGAIVGGSLKRPVPKNEYLCTAKQYADFELRLKFKVLGESANAGVQIRSHRVPKSNEMIGYQADLGNGIWGKLYDERRHKLLVGPSEAEQDKFIKPGDWNEYVIRCQDRRVQFWINGQQTVDYTEPDRSIPQVGVIGLQIHQGLPSEAWYKDLTIEELQPSK